MYDDVRMTFFLTYSSLDLLKLIFTLSLTDRSMDGQTDARKDSYRDVRMHIVSLVYLQLHLFAQKY